MAKITDVAKLAGVAKSTVSNVLSGHRYVSPEIKERVLKACKQLNFRPNFYAQTLSSKAKSNIVSLLLEQSASIDSSPIYQSLLKAVLKGAAKEGYALLTYYSYSDETLENVLSLGRAPIDGSIIMTPFFGDLRISKLASEQIPSVIIGRPDNDYTSFIDIDNIDLMTSVCNELYKIYGTDIYFINSPEGMTISEDRLKAFSTFCKLKSINIEGRVFNSPNLFSDGYEIAKKVAKKNSFFITVSGHVSQGIYDAIKEKGLEIGKDVGVFSLGTSIDPNSFNPKLSYAEQDYNLIGEEAIKTLIYLIKNPGNGPIKKLLPSQIIYSDSTKR